MLRPWAKILIVILVGGILAFSIYLYRTLQSGRAEATPARLENVNPGGEFVGPEGIQFDASGNLYIGDMQGRVWRLERGGTPSLHVDLGRMRLQLDSTADTSENIHIGGMAFDSAGNLYVCAYGFANGAILRVEAGTRRIEIFARDLGVANYLVISGNGKRLYVSDYRKSGRILRYALDQPLPAGPDQTLRGLEFPNGLALGKDDRMLYAAETYTGRVVRLSFGSPESRPEHIADLRGRFASGSLDGLAFDPRDTDRRFLYVAENLRGLFTILDLQARPPRAIKRISMALMGGRPCPASMVIRDGYLYFTDLWACSPIRILFGMPEYHNHAFRFAVRDWRNFY